MLMISPGSSVPASGSKHLLLAGGGHSHMLTLRRWSMRPGERPPGLITLISDTREALYSGMVPGLIAKTYTHQDANINLQSLADAAGVNFIESKITGLELKAQTLELYERDPIQFGTLSLNIGAISDPNLTHSTKRKGIKPLGPALAFIESNDCDANNPEQQEFSVIGAGLAGMEVALALRCRWPKRQITIHCNNTNTISHSLQHAITKANINLTSDPPNPNNQSTMLVCTGSHTAAWLKESGLPVDNQGRVLTNSKLQVNGHPNIFASGDCGVIANAPRPPTGVWAVRAATTLATNLGRQRCGLPLQKWRPQKKALQLLSQPSSHQEPAKAWLLRGRLLLGPHPLLWHWKHHIDLNFMAKFKPSKAMTKMSLPMDCRGCAAKLPAEPLLRALDTAGLSTLGRAPEDATALDEHWLQSVDGFPALVSDPWLNAKLTTLHACSDLWACGSSVHSAQAIITLPKIDGHEQEALLSQSLSAIQTTLAEQGAILNGGHTLESRDPAPTPVGLGIQIALCVNGTTPKPGKVWRKGGCQPGDILLLSRPLGTGVLFAASMNAASEPRQISKALAGMSQSQHHLVKQLRSLEKQHTGCIHACTDITGFGLLGHLGEMLEASSDQSSALINLDTIPALDGALKLLMQGYASTLAPSNRQAWSLLDPQAQTAARVILNHSEQCKPGSMMHRALLELLVDPQTCGPLLISCSPNAATHLIKAANNWSAIGAIQA